MKPFIFLPEADEDAVTAADWYQKRAGLGDEFLAAVSSAVQDLRVDPSSHERVHGNYRRRRVNEFPYDIIFEEQEEIIIVIAVSHHHRRPKYWRRRK